MINTKTLQEFLRTDGKYSGVADGIFGPMSYAGARAAIGTIATHWPNDRVMIGLTQLFLNKVNDAKLVTDGMSGPRTVDAMYVYNTTLLRAVKTFWPRQSDVRAGRSIFGKPGANLAMVQCPYLMFGDYQRKIKVPQFAAHKKVKPSIERVLKKTLDHYGPAQIRKLNLDIFSGCYNFRSTTGSSTLSMHSWAIALDIDAAHNQYKQTSATAAFAKPVYAPFLDFWEDEGWVNLGRARNKDWMHMQAARF